MARKKTTKEAIVVAAKVLVFTSPESSNVEGGSYDPETETAVIAFRDKKKDGATTFFYTYTRVKQQDFEELMNAESKGKHMRSVFTTKYRGSLLQERVS